MTTELEQLTPQVLDEIESEIADSPEYWEAVRDEAEAVLASVKPTSKSAKAVRARQHLAEYNEWRRTYLVPNKWTGKWTTSEGRYVIQTAKAAKVNDMVTVKTKSGEKRSYRLTEILSEGLFSGYTRIDVEVGVESATRGASA